MRTQCLQRNITLIYFIWFASALTFFLPIFALYLKEQLFTVFNVGIVIAVESATVALLEIPTGYLADRFGRKKMIVVGLCFDLLAILLLATAETLPQFLLYAVIIAFAAALSSGTYDAFIFDTLQELNQKKLYKKIQGRMSVVWTVGIATASLCGGFMANFSLRLPIYTTLIPFSLALLFSFYLTEPRYQQSKEKILFLRHIKDVVHNILFKKQLLILTLVLVLGVNILGPIFDLRPLFYEANAIPIEWFGILAAAGFGLYGIGAFFSHSLSELLGNKVTMLCAVTAIVLLVIGSTMTTGFLAASLLISAYLAMGLHNPIESHMINLEIASHNRATVLSTINFFKSLLLVLSMPLMGILIDTKGIHQSFQWFALGGIIIIALLFILKEKNE